MQDETWKRLVDEVGAAFAVGAADRDASDAFVAEHYPVLRERGFVSMMVPEALGGAGASHTTTCQVLRELARYDGATALALSMHQHLVAAQVFNHRRGQERATKLLERVADERLVLVSTGAGDWLESNGRLARVDGGYLFSAAEPFASGSPAGDIAITSAPYEHPTDGWQVLHFAVPMKAPGVRVGDDWRAHGMRGSGSHTLHFESVFVPDHAVALQRPRGAFHPVWNVIIAVALPLISAVYVGVAQRAAEVARGLAKKRANDPAVQSAIGEMDSARILAEVSLDGMTALSNDLDFTPSVELTNRMLALKTATVGAARACVEAAFEAAGGSAFFRHSELERLLRDVRAGDFHLMQPRAQRLFTGRIALGLDPVSMSSQLRSS